MNSVLALPNSIGGIRLYAICILIGIIIAYISGVKEGKRLGLSSSFISYGVIIIVPIAIIGARLWYFLFNISEFSSFAEFFGFRNGRFIGLSGLAIQGGVIASLIAIFIYCKINKVSLYKVLDIVAPGFLIGQICGRYGNFFNQELYGAVVNNTEIFRYLLPSWIVDNMYIQGAYRHPVFLYESSLNLIGLIVILQLRKKYNKLKSGDLMGVYLCWYGLVRIFTETLRTQSGVNEPLKLGPIYVSILLSVIFVITGILYLILKRCIKKLNGNVLYKDIIKENEDNKIDTVIFDLDGTLLNTKPLIDATFKYVFDKYYPSYQLTDEELNSFFGPTLYQTFSRFEKDDKKIDEMISCYRSWNKEHHNDYVRAFSGARELLYHLNKKGYKVCVVSSKIKEMVEYGLESNGLLRYVDYIIGEGEIIPKPNPEGILQAINHFKFAKNAIYIGDNASDIYAAHNADLYYKNNNINHIVKSCGVLYSLKLEELEKANPNYYINELLDLEKILNM